MARGPLHRGRLRPKAEQQAARAEAFAKVLELLQEGPKTSSEMYEVIGGARSTLPNYLRHMHQKLRVIRMTGEYRNRAELWELGADPALPDPEDDLDSLIAPKRGVHPARQLGMRRDPLVAALFGPAQAMGAAA